MGSSSRLRPAKYKCKVTLWAGTSILIINEQVSTIVQRNIVIYLVVRIICVTFAPKEKRSLEAKQSEKE